MYRWKIDSPVSIRGCSTAYRGRNVQGGGGGGRRVDALSIQFADATHKSNIILQYLHELEILKVHVSLLFPEGWGGGEGWGGWGEGEGEGATWSIWRKTKNQNNKNNHQPEKWYIMI